MQKGLNYCRESIASPTLSYIVNRPDAAWAVLKSPSSLINSFGDPFVKNLQETVNH